MKLSDHFGKANYHAEVVQLASNFIDIMSGCTQPVSNQLVSVQVQKVKENRQKLCSIAMLSSTHAENKAFHCEAMVMIESMKNAIHMQIMATLWSS